MSVNPVEPRPRYKPYRQYKDSGVEWMGEIPAHWEAAALKRRTRRIQTGSTPPTGETQYYQDGVVPWYGPGSFTEDLPLAEPVKFLSASAVRDGVARKFEARSAVIVTIGATIGKVAFMEYPGSCNQQITAVTFDLRQIFPKYGAYQLKRLEPVLRGIAPNTTLPIVDQEEIGHLPLAVPPASEQEAIAAFLDRETARIDGLVAKKERLIELLQEKRSALLTRAVTKGLDPNVPMKDSGVEWLGEIPAHWEVTRLRYGCSLLRDGTHQPPPRVAGGYPLLSVRNIVDGRFIRLPDDSLVSEADFRILERAFAVKENDVVLAVVGATLGKVAIVSAMEPFTIQRSVAVLRPRPGLLHYEYLAHFLASRPFQSLLWKNTGFSAQPGIYLGALASFHLPVPPTQEQLQIVESLRLGVERIDSLISKVRTAIDRLRELRTALISAAVTGKIDVRQESP
jgi:type I restriction enzyme S subunit